MRAPDIAFIRRERLAAVSGVAIRKFATIRPDLAVETVSPNDAKKEVGEKTQWWLRCGVRQVWVMNPDSRTVTVHLPDATSRTFSREDTLTGDEVVPGFSLPLAKVFAD